MDKFKQQINDILAMIEKDEIRKKILNFFTKDIKAYSQKLIELAQKIETNGIVADETNKKCLSFTNEILQKAEELEKVVDRRALKKIKDAFRMSLIDGPAYESLIVKRAYDKPRGYPGDYQIIELFYDNKPISKGIGFYGDKYILNDNYVRAIRKRKDCMKKIIDNFIKNSESSSTNILDIGCGSCREIRELFMSNFNTSKKLIFTLVDQDKDALVFSRNAFKHISEHIPKNVKFNFVKENIFNFFKNKKYKNMLKGQNMIYSIGLADYLPDIYLGRLIKFCFELLEPKGKIIIAHKNIKRYKALAPDWFCGWSFFPRNRRNLVDIVKTYIDKSNYDIKFGEENLKYIFFMVINKL
jgi:extracellular factor (EF) 3-hydroxypalmitic acid methyl ester biosynthesis protein